MRAATPTSVNTIGSSSPDPLASSFSNDNNVTYPSHGSRQSSPQRRSASPLKGVRRSSRSTSVDLGVIPSSPFRTVSEQNLSPWKIRVTVEAEPEDTTMEGISPIRTTTLTTRVPLRQDSSPIEGKKTASRGRKPRPSSDKSRRSVTPLRTARGASRTRRQSVTDLDIRPLGDDAESDDWTKQKKSPRKKRSTRARKSTTAAEERQQTSPSTIKDTTRASSRAPFEVRADTDIEDGDGITHQDAAVPETGSPELRQIDLNRVSVRSRALSTKSRTDEEQDQLRGDSPAHVKKHLDTKISDARKVSVNSAMSYPTPSPTSSYHGESDERTRFSDDKSAEIRPEGDFDTILESEGFTMIDLDSIPSARQLRSSPLDDSDQNNGISSPQTQTSQSNPPQPTTTEQRPASELHPTTRQRPMVTYPTLSVDESDISSTVPSSPPPPRQDRSLLAAPIVPVRKVTPQISSSPKLPSPPKQILRRTPHHAHRGSAGALFAGIALQDVVSPSSQGSILHSTKRSTTSFQESPGPLFDGFDSSTKRELRAGLRFGEELAKRQTSSPILEQSVQRTNSSLSDAESNAPLNKIARPPPETQVWRGETIVQRTPVQISINPVEKNTGLDQSLVQTPRNHPTGIVDISYLDTQARREKEWQLEREEIIRQIQDASESQVIVINSDDEENDDETGIRSSKEQDTTQGLYNRGSSQDGSPGPSIHDEDAEEDIWLEQAKNSSSPHGIVDRDRWAEEQSQPKVEMKAEAASTIVDRPRRSLIPSPWKRGDPISAPQEQSTFLCSNLDDQSGMLFWKEPETKVKFGAGEVRRGLQGKKRISGVFDIDIMAGTPKKDQEQYRRISFTSNRTEGHQGQDSTLGDEDSQNLNDSMVADDVDTSEQRYEESSLDPINNTIGAPEAISSPEPPVKIPVNFNDSSINITTPPHPEEGRRSGTRKPFLTEDESTLDSPPRPPTPRSAMKGTRLSLALAVEDDRSDTPLPTRRVVFSERSRGVDVDGMESSFSMKSTTDDSVMDSTAGHLAEQLNRELQASEDVYRPQARPQLEVEEQATRLEDVSEDVTPTPRKETVQSQPVASQSGWRNWIWGSKVNGDKKGPSISDQPCIVSTPGSAKSDSSTPGDNAVDKSTWSKTKSSIPTLNTNSLTPSEQHLPSYLRSPSYPSDPTRATTSPLPTFGPFTNTHFRTLHIIYRKSLRPKFHAPQQIRPSIRKLLNTQLEIDESENGLDRGVMTWTVGEGELEVLERFMQEVEFGYGAVPYHEETVDVIWGWSVEQLIQWLCRIVVGEVVREEESKARAMAKAKAREKINARREAGS